MLKCYLTPLDCVFYIIETPKYIKMKNRITVNLKE